MNESENACKEAINSMLKKSQTKVIFPIIAFSLIKEFNETGKNEFTDSEIRKLYHSSVAFLQQHVGHKLHTGGKYYDAYPIRNLPRYGVLIVKGKQFELSKAFQDNSQLLMDWIPDVIKAHIDSKIGIIPKLGVNSERLILASDNELFFEFINKNISSNPSNFEVFSFSIIKVHLEKFACKIYRDTRTSSHDKGVDLSTNFGVVYQIKKLQLMNLKAAKEVFSEIKINFDSERMNDGKVILIIDDISKEVKNYLINMKVQSISKQEILNMCNQFTEIEDRMKVLRIVYDEFRREYESQI